MDHIPMDVHTVHGNVAVVKLPARRFPGTLIQGDTMKMLADIVPEALCAEDWTVSQQVINEAYDIIRDFLMVYETALQNAGERLPYERWPFAPEDKSATQFHSKHAPE
jgi:hypothetical protein